MSTVYATCSFVVSVCKYYYKYVLLKRKLVFNVDYAQSQQATDTGDAL